MIFYYTFTAESDGERILKIGQHLPKLWANKYRVVFFMKHGVERCRGSGGTEGLCALFHWTGSA